MACLRRLRHQHQTTVRPSLFKEGCTPVAQLTNEHRAQRTGDGGGGLNPVDNPARPAPAKHTCNLLPLHGHSGMPARSSVDNHHYQHPHQLGQTTQSQCTRYLPLFSACLSTAYLKSQAQANTSRHQLGKNGVIHRVYGQFLWLFRSRGRPLGKLLVPQISPKAHKEVNVTFIPRRHCHVRSCPLQTAIFLTLVDERPQHPYTKINTP